MSQRWHMLIQEGNRLYTQGNLNGAAMYFEEAVQEAKNAFGIHHLSYASSLNDLAGIYESIGKYDRAELLYHQALELRENILGREHPDYAISLNNLAWLYCSKREYNKAEPLYQKALDIQERVLGKEHPGYALTVSNLALLYYFKGEYSKSEHLNRQALEIRKRILGKKHSDYVVSLTNLAVVYKEMKEFSKAKSLLQQALNIQENTIGTNHPDYLNDLNHLASLYESLGQYEEAINLFRQVLTVGERVLGRNHPICGESRNNLKLLYRKIGTNEGKDQKYPKWNYEGVKLLKQEKFHEAISYLEKAVKEAQKILGTGHPEYAIIQSNLASAYRKKGEYDKAETLNLKALEVFREELKIEEGTPEDDTYVKTLQDKYATVVNNLAVIYKLQGEYKKAESFYKEALEIRQKVLGKEHPDYLTNLHNLSMLYNSIGNYAQAEQLFCESLKIRKKIFGEEHPDYAMDLEGLAAVYTSMYEYDKAEPLFLQALAVRESFFGKENAIYAESLHNVAEFFLRIRKLDKAEPLYLQALNIKRNILGKHHIDYIRTVNALAQLYSIMEKYNKAESLFRQAVEIQEKMKMNAHPLYARSFIGLAELYHSKGEYSKAEDIYQQALSIQERILGKEHPDYGVSLSDLAMVEFLNGKYSEAFKSSFTALKIEEQMIIQISVISDENRLQNYIQTVRVYLFQLLSIFLYCSADLQDKVSSVLDAVLKYKALVIEIVAIRRDSILAGGSLELKAKFDKLRHARIALAQRYNENPEKEESDQRFQDLHQLKKHIEALEKELASQVTQVALQMKLEKSDSISVAKHLPKDSILAEFVWYQPIDFEKVQRLKPRYMVFLLSHDKETICSIDLGDASEIDELIRKYRNEIIEGERKIVTVVHQEIQQTGEDRELLSGIKLYHKLFSPIVEKLGGKRSLIIAPDANINLLPFEVLPQPNGKYVIEEFDIHYVDSGRDLIRYDFYHKPQSFPLIVADPDFNYPNMQDVSKVAKITVKEFYELHKTIRPRMSPEVKRMVDNVEIPISRLDATLEEGEQIAKFFNPNVSIWTQENVLKGNFKQIQGPQILHIATHGFFRSIQEVDELEIVAQQSMNINPHYNQLQTLSMQNRNYYNPLLNSWLALAGVNTFLQSREPGEGAEDGVITALDITGMDLIGTELVVLSACVTGLGDILPGEGLYGFRRAFTLAGARTLILSLWSVPDEETKELMINFYSKILKGIEKAKALRDSQRMMINERRCRGESCDPYWWGAFVCIGDAGKLGELSQKELNLQPVKTVQIEPDEDLLSQKDI